MEKSISSNFFTGFNVFCTPWFLPKFIENEFFWFLGGRFCVSIEDLLDKLIHATKFLDFELFEWLVIFLKKLLDWIIIQG